MTEEFLAFSASVGNDLSTPRPEFGFGGLVPGDRWCLCADRWQEALDAGVAPPVVLEATHALALEFSSLDDLRAHAVVAATSAGRRSPAQPVGDDEPLLEPVAQDVAVRRARAARRGARRSR